MYYRMLWLSSLLLCIVTMPAQAQSKDDTKPGTQAEQEAEQQSPALIDNFREGLTNAVDRSALWIDSLFADEIDPADYPGSYGSLTISPVWDEHDGFEIDSSFRANLVFPHAEKRLSAIIGRGNFDDFINDTQQTRPTVIRRNDPDEEWMVGLGFDPYVEAEHSLSFGAGFRGGLDLDAYVRARYRYETILGDASEMTLQSVGFWRDSDGFGVAQTIDHEKMFDERWFNKFWIRGTFAERTDGVRWHASNKLYFMYHPERAVGGEVWWYGETRHEVPMQDYGLRALHRSRFKREWLYLESWVGVHWPRELVTEPRKPRWIVGVELEMLFGN